MGPYQWTRPCTGLEDLARPQQNREQVPLAIALHLWSHRVQLVHISLERTVTCRAMSAEGRLFSGAMMAHLRGAMTLLSLREAASRWCRIAFTHRYPRGLHVLRKAGRLLSDEWTLSHLVEKPSSGLSSLWIRNFPKDPLK